MPKAELIVGEYRSMSVESRTPVTGVACGEGCGLQPAKVIVRNAITSSAAVIFKFFIRSSP
jgi:hypothetical protein